MAIYELRFKASVAKDLRGIAKPDITRILDRCAALRDDPRPPGSERLSGDEKYRIRQGDYRVLYTINDREVIVEVVKIGNRREVYR